MAKKKFVGGFDQLLGNNSSNIEISVLPELKSFIPPLSEDEEKLLFESIKAEGVKEPIDVWINNEFEKNIIIDGHNRFKIAQDLDISFATNEHTFSSIDEVKDWMLKKQLGRRNLTDANRTYLVGLLYNNKKVGQGKYDRSDAVNVAQEISASTGMSERSVRNAGDFAKGMDKLSDDLKGHILGGKEKISKSDIQEVAKTEFEEPIDSKEELVEVVSHFRKKRNNHGESDGIVTGFEYQEQYENLMKDVKKRFSKIDKNVVFSVLSDYISIKLSKSDLNKLISDGYKIIRKDNHQPAIIQLDSTNDSWTRLEDVFASNEERDIRFKELLKDNKVIRG